MTSVATDRYQGLNSGIAIKVPARAASTANLTLSGLQTVDGVVLAAGDRVLVKDQTDATENGVYDADTSSWSRSADWDGTYDVAASSLVCVHDGNTLAGTAWRVATDDPITIDTTSVTFEQALFSGLSGVNFTQAGTGAVQRAAQDKMREIVSVVDFGATGDGVADDSAEFLLAANAVDAAGGGRIYVPPGTWNMGSGFTQGDGSDSVHSTKHNRVVFCGAGSGSGAGVTNTQANGVTRLLYTGAANAAAAVFTFAGPLHNVGLEDMMLDCAALAGIGVLVNHVTESHFKKVTVRNYSAIGWSLTTRTGFPTGCAYGNADNVFEQCYGWLDDASLSAATILGLKLNSGVSTSSALAGQPDSARNTFIGGCFMFGTTATSRGIWLSGADNNTFLGTFTYPYGGATSGSSVHFEQWPTGAGGYFPLENAFINVSCPFGISGNGSVGSGWGNWFNPLPTSDAGGTVTLPTGVSGVDHTGKTYIRGVRAYRTRQVSAATLNNSTQSNATTSAADVPGLSVTLTGVLAGSKLRVSFSGRGAKATGGTGFFTLALNASAQGDTRTDVAADGTFHAVSAQGLYDAATGSNTVTVQFTSSNTDAVQISHGTLVVEELG